jgi:hypothetical protein
VKEHSADTPEIENTECVSIRGSEAPVVLVEVQLMEMALMPTKEGATNLSQRQGMRAQITGWLGRIC